MIEKEKLDKIIEESIDSVIYGYNGENVLNKQVVDEAIIHSYDTSFVIRHLMQRFSLAHGIRNYIFQKDRCFGWVEKRKENNDCDVIVVVLPTKHSKTLKEITLSVEKSCGWFLSSKIDINMDGFEAWIFEKKFDNEITQDVIDLGVIYHIFPSSRLAKALHVGLLPKKTTWLPFMLDSEHTFADDKGGHFGWKTIDRVYFFTEKPSDEFLKNNTFSSKEVLTDKYTLLAIDTEKLLPNTRFYSDPRSENAVYTLNNIPPSAITVVE